MNSAAGAQVIVKIVGGLGNQLFCYAAARRLALRTGAELVLDVDFFRSDVRYERDYRLDMLALGPHRVARSARWLPRSLDLRWWRVKRRMALLGWSPGVEAVIERDAKQFHDELLRKAVSGKVLLDGYWQDERYFEDIRPTLLQELVPRVTPVGRNAALGEQLRQGRTAVVHCRRHHHRLADGSRQQPRGREGLTAAYYQRAIQELRVTAGVDAVCLFGDDPGWLEQNVPANVPRTVVDWNRDPGGEVLDLWLMTQARHFVVSNSTLSWWGAWLAAAPGARVIAPRRQDLEYWVPNARDWQEIDW
jgi:hypothetical protein